MAHHEIGRQHARGDRDDRGREHDGELREDGVPRLSVKRPSHRVAEQDERGIAHAERPAEPAPQQQGAKRDGRDGPERPGQRRVEEGHGDAADDGDEECQKIVHGDSSQK